MIGLLTRTFVSRHNVNIYDKEEYVTDSIKFKG